MIEWKVFETGDFQEYRISFISYGQTVCSRYILGNENFVFLKRKKKIKFRFEREFDVFSAMAIF